MWQRFTERARKLVFFAQEEAGKLGENNVCTEHLLLGLLRDSDSVANRILDISGAPPDVVRIEVESRAMRGSGRSGQDMKLDPQSKRVIDLAYDEARSLGNDYIGTEHLLLGLIREGDGLAGQVLSKFRIKLGKVRKIVVDYQAGRISKDTENPEAKSQSEACLTSKRLAKAVACAAQQAQSIGAPLIESEHLLLAVIDDKLCVGASCLLELNLDLDELSKELRARKAFVPQEGHIPSLSPSAQIALNQAQNEARLRDQALCGTSHLLLALLKDRTNGAGAVLSSHGITYGNANDLLANRWEDDI